MPVRIGKLSANTATVAVEIDGETLNVVYRPSGLTPETEDRLQEMVKEQRGGASLIVLLREILVSWDLLDDNDQPLPVDERTLRGLPITLLSRVAEAISDDMRPNPQSGGRSAAG